MASYEKDDVPMLSDAQAQLFNENEDSRIRAYLSRTQSAISMPMNPMDTFQNEANLVGYTGPLRSQRKVPMIQMSGPIYTSGRGETNFQHHQGATSKNIAELKTENIPSFKRVDQHHWSDDKYARKNEHLLRSGQLGLCNDPYCTTCPTYFKPAQQKHSKASVIFDLEFHNALYGDAKGWARKFVSFLGSCIPGVMNPHTKVVQRWNKFFAIICLLAIFVDPLYFFLLSVKRNNNNNCVNIDWRMTTILIFVRSTTDFLYLLNILLQFRLAYVAPETKVVGAGQLVDQPKKIAWHYFCGYFLVDLFSVLPLPQIISSQLLNDFVESSDTNTAITLLQALVLAQYILRLYRFLPLLIGVSPIGFVFETAKANFLINLLTIMLSGHVVGSCWYLFALQRLNRCLHDACLKSNIKMDSCLKFIDCGDENKFTELDSKDKWTSGINNDSATACFTEEDRYGIYVKAVNLSAQSSVITRYVYSLSWGFLQISTLAGNLEPSYSAGEAFFTMVIIGLGLLLFAFLIGNIQNFLQALDRRRLEMTLRRRDFEQWMSHRRLPEELRRKVHEAERYNWAATRGVNEEMLLENLPEDLQRDIRRHLFKFVKEVWIFALMDNNVLDAICERLKPKIYIKGGEILYRGGLIEKMVFIVRGKLESIGEDGTTIPLIEGNVCGEELLAWCLEHSSVSKDGKKIKVSGQRLLSSRTVRCLTNVEAFSLRAADLEEVTELFSRNLRNPRVQAAIRYESPYWRGLAATCIQVAWRYRQKRLKRSSTFQSNHPKYY